MADRYHTTPGAPPPAILPPPGAPPAAPAAAAPPSSGIIPDPANPGYYTDGRNYYKRNPDGSVTQTHDLDLGSQVARNLTTGAGYAGNAGTNANQFNQAFNSQMSLADMLKNTIQNSNAPSVAAEQEKQSLAANEATQLSNASGVGGQNAFLARRGAANNMAALGAQDAQTGALRRAQEVQGAEQNLGGVLGTAGGQASGMYGTNTNLGLGYSQLAGGEEQGGNANVTNQRGQNIGILTGASTGAGSGLASAATSSPAAAAAPAAVASDKRLKHNIQEEPRSNEEHFMNALSGKSFEYNADDEEDPERHGILTEQLKKSKIGRSLVRTDASGYEGFDVGQGLGAALSALGYLHRKVTELEKDRHE